MRPQNTAPSVRYGAATKGSGFCHGLGILSLTAATLLAAGGPGPSGSGSGSTLQVALHIPNETAPPGGLAQMKFMVTQPTPISTGGPVAPYDAAMFDGVWGIQVFCATGDLNGVAMINGARVNLLYTTTAGAQGTDYPIMTMALHVRPDAVPGSKTQFQLDPSSTWTLGSLGTATLAPTPPAIVTVGGSVSILDVVPGGGVLPAGSVVSIKGMGFQPKTQVQLNAIKFSSIQFVSTEEIQFTLAADTNMTGQKIQVFNPDGSQDTYFSYLRGIPLAASKQPLLAGAVPVFSSMTHSWAQFTPMAPASVSQFTGIALQNPGVAPANVTVALYSAANALLGTSSVTVPSGYRLMEETSELTGSVPGTGSYAVVSSTQPIQVFGFVGDNAAGTVTPFTPVLSQP
jgi:hypothetical protein